MDPSSQHPGQGDQFFRPLGRVKIGHPGFRSTRRPAGLSRPGFPLPCCNTSVNPSRARTAAAARLRTPAAQYVIVGLWGSSSFQRISNCPTGISRAPGRCSSSYSFGVRTSTRLYSCGFFHPGTAGPSRAGRRSHRPEIYPEFPFFTSVRRKTIGTQMKTEKHRFYIRQRLMNS